MLRVRFIYYYPECRPAECLYAECRHAECFCAGRHYAECCGAPAGIRPLTKNKAMVAISRMVTTTKAEVVRAF
jgi:hypothetical protein